MWVHCWIAIKIRWPTHADRYTRSDPSHRQSQDWRSRDYCHPGHTQRIHNKSSQYAPPKSEIESYQSIGVQRMLLGPTRSSHLHDRAEWINIESLSAAIRATGDDTSAIKKHLLSFIDNAMELFKQIKRSRVCQEIYPNLTIKTPSARETYCPEFEMESVRSIQGRSNFGNSWGHTPYESEGENRDV